MNEGQAEGNGTNVIEITTTEGTNQVETAGSKPDQIRNKVTTLLSNSSAMVQTNVVNHLVEIELKKRADLVLDGLKKLDEANEGLKKIKPDMTTFNGDGTKKDESYSQNKINELKKAKEKAANIEKALEQALGEQPNFAQLEKVCKGGGDNNKETAEQKA